MRRIRTSMPRTTPAVTTTPPERDRGVGGPTSDVSFHSVHEPARRHRIDLVAAGA